MAVDCGTWWTERAADTYAYVTAARDGDERRKAETAAKLLSGADEWGRLTGILEAAEIMRECAGQAKALADAAFSRDKAGIDSAVDALLSNAERQTAIYESAIPDFPADAWEPLATAHIAATGGYILALSDGDTEDFRRNFDQAVRSRDLLAALWREICMRIGRR